jgi:carbon storage regulator
MLILSRKPGESIVIDGRIKVTIVRVEGEAVKVGIEAPAQVPVHRQEVYDEIQRSNQQALMRQNVALPKLAGTHRITRTPKPADPAHPNPSPLKHA